MILINRIFYYFANIIILVFGSSVFVSGQCNFTQGPIGELCSSAIYICGSDLDGYTSKLPEELSANQQWPALCGGNGTADNIIWFSFTACSEKVTLQIIPSNCVVKNNSYIGLQAGMYEKCNKSASVACTDHTSGDGITTTITLSYDKFVPGSIAYFFLDGYAGSVCDFKIKVIEGIDTQPVTPPDPSTLSDGAITGINTISCEQLNTSQTYNLTPPQCEVNYNSTCNITATLNPADSVCYVWQISPLDGRYFTNQDSTGRSTEITFTKPGVYTINADPYLHPYYGGSCANAACGDIISWQVVVEGPDTLINPIEILCPGDFRDFCGHTITTDSVVYCNSDPCNIIQQAFKVERSNLNVLGTQYICAGGSYNFQGIDYSFPGLYNVVDVSDCSLVHRFNVEVISLSISLNADTTVLNCNTTEIKIKASGISNGPLPLSYSWRDQNNMVLSTDTELNVVAAGRYFAKVIYDNDGINCDIEQFIDISSDFKKPSVTAFKPTVRCLSSKDPKHVLTLLSADPLLFSEWTLPLGGKTNGLNVQLDSLNAASGLPYKFFARSTNGCTLDTSFVINTNFEKASVTLTGDDLTCYNPRDTLILTTNISVDSIRWFKTLPQQAFYGSDPSKRSLPIDKGGTYKAEVMASSSKCWSDASIVIIDKIIYPNVSLQNGLKWNCNTKFIEIKPSATVGQTIKYTWNSVDGVINSDAKDMTLIAGAPGNYVIQVLNVENGCERRDTVNISQESNIPKSMTVKAQDILCFGESNGIIDILDVDGGFGPYNYYVNGIKSDKLNITDLPKGEYLLEVRDKFDCSTTVKTIINEPEVFNISLPLELTIAFSVPTELTFTASYPDEDILSIIWTNSKNEILGTDFTLQYSSNVVDIVTVDVTTENGCTARAKIKVNVDNELKLYFPNIFSPNGDGFNDKLQLFKNTIPAEIEQISIFDRYGNKVYQNDSFGFGENSDGWDGTFNSKPVEVGVYIMMIELIDFAGNKKVITKDLTLVR